MSCGTLFFATAEAHPASLCSTPVTLPQFNNEKRSICPCFLETFAPVLLLSCDPRRHTGPETTQEAGMEISHRAVTQWDPSRLEVPFGVTLPPTANVEEKLLGAKTGIAVLGDDDDEGDEDGDGE